MYDVVIPLKEQAMLTTLLTQPHRHYHNIDHINDLLNELDDWAKYAGYADNVKKLVTYGIWYHDAIYNTYAVPGSNERLSARLFEEQHPEFELFDLNRVNEMILATAKHTSQQDMIEGENRRYIDVHNAVMLDCDLSGFGQSWEIYEANGENIRLEYYKTSDADFYAGRYQFMMKMHQRMKLFGSIYYTRHFQGKYDEQSKANVEQDIIDLEDILDVPAEKSILTWNP